MEASSLTLSQLTSLPELWLGLPSDMLTAQVISSREWVILFITAGKCYLKGQRHEMFDL